MADRPSPVAGEGSARAAAFTRLADEHLDKAYHLARAILGDETEAQDAAHDAFVQAWRKWETLRDPARFEQWFDRILVNACRDRLRARSRQATDISAEVALATGDHAARTDDQTALDAAIATLSPDHQVVVALRYLPRSYHRRHRGPARHPVRDRPVAPALRAQTAARGARRRRQREDPAMNDQELETRLRARYRAEASETEPAPLSLRRDVAAIPRTATPPRRLFGRGRGVTLLAAAAADPRRRGAGGGLRRPATAVERPACPIVPPGRHRIASDVPEPEQAGIGEPQPDRCADHLDHRRV